MVDEAFVVHVSRLRKEPGSRRSLVLRGPVDADAGSGHGPGDPRVPDGAEAVCEVLVEAIPGGVMASGTVTAPWVGVCGRCTAPVSGEISAGVIERYTDDGDRFGDDEAYPIVNDRIDLAPVVHDVVLLELPMAPLCNPTCLGLCPHCGTDRNRSECDCVAPRDPRWASLDVLRTTPEQPPGAGRASGFG